MNVDAIDLSGKLFPELAALPDFESQIDDQDSLELKLKKIQEEISSPEHIESTLEQMGSAPLSISEEHKDTATYKRKTLIRKKKKKKPNDYYYKAKADVLVDHSVDVRGSNVELAGMAFKRLIMYNELPKRKKFNCAKIKLITGDKYIKARFNHSNNS